MGFRQKIIWQNNAHLFVDSYIDGQWDNGDRTKPGTDIGDGPVDIGPSLISSSQLDIYSAPVIYFVESWNAAP